MCVCMYIHIYTNTHTHMYMYIGSILLKHFHFVLSPSFFALSSQAKVQGEKGSLQFSHRPQVSLQYHSIGLFSNVSQKVSGLASNLITEFLSLDKNKIVKKNSNGSFSKASNSHVTCISGLKKGRGRNCRLVANTQMKGKTFLPLVQRLSIAQ